MSKKIISWKWLTWALWFAIIMLVIILWGIEIWRLFWFDIILSNIWFLLGYYVTLILILVWIWAWLQFFSWKKLKNIYLIFIVLLVMCWYLVSNIYTISTDIISWPSYYEWKCSLKLENVRHHRKHSYNSTTFFLFIPHLWNQLGFKISENYYRKLWWQNINPNIWFWWYVNNYECNSEIKINYLKNSKFILDLKVKNPIRKYDNKKIELEPSWNIIVNWELIDVSKLINQ